QRSCPNTPDDCEHRACEDKQFYSHEPILLTDTPKSEKKICHLVNPHNLGALEAKAGHQALLIESEGVNAAMQGVGGEASGHPFVHDDEARVGPDLPAARVVYPIHRILVH